MGSEESRIKSIQSESVSSHKENVKKMRKDMISAIEFEEFSDFLIQVESDEFPVHKIVLYHRSRHFRDLFEQDPELKENSYPSLSPGIVEKVIEWIYSGSVSLTSDLIPEMVEACNVFRIPTLLCAILERFPALGSPEEAGIKASVEITIQDDSIIFTELDPINFSAAINSKKFSDTTFLIDGEEVFAHRVFLCARSKYYQVVFLSGMLESKLEEIVTPLVEHNSFLSMLAFIYGGSVDFSRVTNIIDIMKLADRILMDDLLHICELIIAKSINRDNGFEALLLALDLNSSWLQRHIVDEYLSEYGELSSIKSYNKLNYWYKERIDICVGKWNEILSKEKQEIINNLSALPNINN